MKKASVLTVGVLALLGSAASMATSVEVIPSTGITNPCCTATIPFPPPSNFYVTLHMIGLPGNGSTTGSAGSTLTISFNSAVVSLTGASLSPGSQFDFISTPTVIDANTVIISVLNGQNTLGFGTFDVYRINFTTVAPGFANIVVIDDGADNSWVDQDGNPIPMTYTQANVTVGAVPLAAVGWLLAPAFGVLGVRRRRAAA